MPVKPGLGLCCRIGPNVARIAVRQIESEEMRLLLDSPDHDKRFTKVSLRMPRRMTERHEHLLAGALPGPDVVLDDGVSAIKAALIAQPFEDTLCGMVLFAWPDLVFGKLLVDLTSERIQLRPPDRCRPPIPGRFRIGQHLRHTVPADAKVPGNRPAA